MDDGRIGWISDCKFCQAIFLELNHNLLEASIYLKSPSESSEGLFSWDFQLCCLTAYGYSSPVEKVKLRVNAWPLLVPETVTL